MKTGHKILLLGLVAIVFDHLDGFSSFESDPVGFFTQGEVSRILFHVVSSLVILAVIFYAYGKGKREKKS